MRERKRQETREACLPARLPPPVCAERHARSHAMPGMPPWCLPVCLQASQEGLPCLCLPAPPPASSFPSPACMPCLPPPPLKCLQPPFAFRGARLPAACLPVPPLPARRQQLPARRVGACLAQGVFLSHKGKALPPALGVRRCSSVCPAPQLPLSSSKRGRPCAHAACLPTASCLHAALKLLPLQTALTRRAR